MPPSVVISLDFELRWGLTDVLGPDFRAYRKNLEGVVDVVPALLELFASRNVGATWAVVGALACANWDEFNARAPASPRYLDASLRLDPAFLARNDPAGRLHFAPDLVRAITQTPGQELGSHTFSHIYFREPGCMQRDVEADVVAVNSLFHSRFGTTPRSLVFPRNQVAFTEILARHGMTTWRDNPDTWYWAATTGNEQLPLARALRLLDAMAPLGRRAFDRKGRDHRASHFVRFALPSPAFALHTSRIVRDVRVMTNDQTVHLWFHPHNLGANPRGNVARLATLLDAISRERPDVRFVAMAENRTR